MSFRRCRTPAVASLAVLLSIAGPAWGQGKLTPPPSAARTQVMVLGTFHFQDAGHDDFQPRFDVDVLSPERQVEVAELLDRLARFAPTAIALEWPADAQDRLDTVYAAFRAGTRAASANERDQLGFRLAARLGHDRVIAVDAPARWYDSALNTDTLVQRARRFGQDALLARGMAWNAYYTARAEWEDSLKTTQTLRETLSAMNTMDALRQTLGQYLAGSVEVGGGGDYTGADMRSAWYNRNLRIFTNLLRMQSDHEERILVIIGAGHAPLLRHFIENAPELQFVPPEMVLR